MGLFIASLFMSLERIEGLSKVLEPWKGPLVLCDSAMATERQTEKREEIGKERANKTARVKWGRGKREENGK